MECVGLQLLDSERAARGSDRKEEKKESIETRSIASQKDPLIFVDMEDDSQEMNAKVFGTMQPIHVADIYDFM